MPPVPSPPFSPAPSHRSRTNYPMPELGRTMGGTSKSTVSKRCRE